MLFILGCTPAQNMSDPKEELRSNPNGLETVLEIEFIKGKAFNHPSFAFWTEDTEGNYIETLFVTGYVAKGRFGHGEIEKGRWKNEPGVVRRPATLPYWAHKRNIEAPDGLYVPSPETPVPDAISGATPAGNFFLSTGTKAKSGKIRLLMEINQPWDPNDYWTNSKYPEDFDYGTSLQPALVYAVTIDLDSGETEYHLNPIGHSHPSGKNGKLFTNISTLSSAKEIAAQVIVRIK